MAADNNLDLALRIKADGAQANAALAQVQAQLEGVGKTAAKTSATSAASSKAAADAAGQEAAAVESVAAAQSARIETEAEAAARIHAMVQASLEAVEAERARGAAMAATSQSLHVAADANSAFTKSSIELAASQTAAMQAATAARAPYLAVQQLLEKSTITTAEFDAASLALSKSVGTGAITAGEYAAALNLLDAVKIKDVAASTAQTVANEEAALSSRAQSEIATAVSEVLSGNFGRLRRTGAAFANQAGLLSKLMSPMGLAFAAAAVAVGVFGEAIYTREKDLLDFNKALAATGNYAGTTGIELQGIAEIVGEYTNDYGNATKAVLALAQSGQVLGSQMQQMATIAVNMAYITGQSIESITKELIGLQGDPTQAIVKTTAAMGLLTAAQYDEIVETQQQQGASAAAALAMKDLADASDSARTKLVANAGVVIKTWSNFKSMLEDIGHDIASIGATQSTGAQIASLQHQLTLAYGEAQGGGNPNPNQDADVVRLRSQIAALQQQQKSEAMFAAGQELANQGKEAHDKALAEALASKTQGDEGFVAQAAAINKKRYAALLGIVDPSIRDRVNEAYDQQIRDAVKRANEQYGGSGGSPSFAIDHAQQSAAVAAAQQAIKQVQDIYANGAKALAAEHQAGLINDAAYYDAERGMLTVWEDDKVAALEKEKVAAQSHIGTQADRIKADQKVGEIDQQITQVHAEASAKRQAIDANEAQAIKKTADAWDKFKNSLGTPLEIQTGHVLDKLRELDQFFTKDATGGEAGYADALNRIFGGIDGKGPSGVSSLLEGSRFGAQMAEVQQYYQQVDQIQQTAYQKEMAAAQGNAQRQLDIQKAYETASLQSAQNKAAADAAIQRQEAQYSLTAAEQGFGALAQVYAEAYGEQSKQAKIAFALQKASALANAILAIQESVANSAKLGFPWNIISIAGAIAQGASVLATIRSTNLNVTGLATGGPIRGPGTGTSDSVLIRGSNGEYVHNASAVGYYGEAFMDAVNNKTLPKLPGYAAGGMIGSSAPTPSDLGFKAPSMPTIHAASVTVAPVQVVIHNQGGGQAQVKQSTGNNGAKLIDVFITAAASDIANNGKIPKALEQKYNIRRKGQSYG